MNRTGTWIEVTGLVLIAVVAGTVANLTASASRRLAWIGDMPLTTAAATIPTGTAAGSGEVGSLAEPTPPATTEIEITTEEAHRDWSDGALFLDARVSDSYYTEGHITGARNFAVWEGDINGKIVNLMSEMPTDSRIITYCTGGNCEDSHLLREKLLAAGFTNIAVYKDGFPGWVAAAHPVEK